MVEEEVINRRDFLAKILKPTITGTMLLAFGGEFMLVELEPDKSPETTRYSVESLNPPDLRSYAVAKGFPRKHKKI